MDTRSRVIQALRKHASEVPDNESVVDRAKEVAQLRGTTGAVVRNWAANWAPSLGGALVGGALGKKLHGTYHPATYAMGALGSGIGSFGGATANYAEATHSAKQRQAKLLEREQAESAKLAGLCKTAFNPALHSVMTNIPYGTGLVTGHTEVGEKHTKEGWTPARKAALQNLLATGGAAAGAGGMYLLARRAKVKLGGRNPLQPKRDELPITANTPLNKNSIRHVRPPNPKRADTPAIRPRT